MAFEPRSLGSWSKFLLLRWGKFRKGAVLLSEPARIEGLVVRPFKDKPNIIDLCAYVYVYIYMHIYRYIQI